LPHLFELLTDELGAVELRDLPPRQIAQQRDTAQVDEPNSLQVETYGFICRKGLIAQLSNLFDPWSNEVPLELELDGLNGVANH
jgi:hypothetical protein